MYRIGTENRSALRWKNNMFITFNIKKKDVFNTSYDMHI